MLIVGEPGTGKELLAQSLLLAGPGTFDGKASKPAPSDSVNLAGLPVDLVAGTLFGHEKGAFTGANQQRRGLFERCAGGAVFLDEVADLPPRPQVGLLRCLQEGRVRRLGSDTDIEAAPRILSATHRDLDALVARDRFRVDLHHRLSAVVIGMPPLRERRGDIVPLAERLLARAGLGAVGMVGLIEANREAIERRGKAWGVPGLASMLQGVGAALGGFGGAMLTRLLTRQARPEVVESMQDRLAGVRRDFEALQHDRHSGVMNEWAHRAGVELLFGRAQAAL